MPLRQINRRVRTIESYTSGTGERSVAYPAAFLVAAGLETLLLGMNFYLQEVYGATGGQIGAFFAARSLVYVIGCLLAWKLTSAIGPRYILIACPFLTCVFALAIHYGDSLVLAFVFCALTGISNSLFWPTLMGWISSSLEGPQLSKTMGRFNLSWSSGAIVSPYLASRLSQAGTVLPIYAASAMFFIAGILILGARRALPNVRNKQHVAIAEPKTRVDTGESTVLRYAGWIGAFTAFLAFAVLVNIFPKFARTDLYMSKGTIGAIFSIRSLFATLAFVALGRTVFWHYRGSQMLIGQFCIVAALLAMVYAHRPVTIGIIQVVAGMMMAFSYSYSMFHSLAGSRNRAGRSAFHEASVNAGFVCGSFFGGLLYQYYSIAAIYVFCAVVVILGMIAQAAITIWARKVEPVRR